jgi:hypothetical protein
LQNIFEKAENKSMQTAKHYAPLKERMVVLLANSLLAYVIFVFRLDFGCQLADSKVFGS